jgi:hypothetical protein
MNTLFKYLKQTKMSFFSKTNNRKRKTGTGLVWGVSTSVRERI